MIRTHSMEFRSNRCYLYCSNDFKALEIWSYYNDVWKWIRKNECFANVVVFETHSLNVATTRRFEFLKVFTNLNSSISLLPSSYLSRLLSFMSTLLRFASSYSLRRLHSGMWLFHSVAILLPPTYLLRSQSYATIPLWCKKRLVKFTRPPKISHIIEKWSFDFIQPRQRVYLFLLRFSKIFLLGFLVKFLFNFH